MLRSCLDGGVHRGLCHLATISTEIRSLLCTLVHDRAVIASVHPVWGGAGDFPLGHEKVWLCSEGPHSLLQFPDHQPHP